MLVYRKDTCLCEYNLPGHMFGCGSREGIDLIQTASSNHEGGGELVPTRGCASWEIIALKEIFALAMTLDYFTVLSAKR